MKITTHTKFIISVYHHKGNWNSFVNQISGKNSIKLSLLFTFVQDALQGRKTYSEYNKQMLYQVSINQHKLSYVAKQ